MADLPDLPGRGTYLTNPECLQTLSCTDHEFTLLRDAVLSIGTKPSFDGKTLFDQDLRKFDSLGRHRRKLWAEVERSNPLFAELLAGKRQNCDAKTWSEYVTRVKSAIVYIVVKPLRKKIASTNGAKSIPKKRGSTSEVIDLDNDTEHENEQVKELDTTLGSETSGRPEKRPKLSSRTPDAPEISLSSTRNITPLRKSVNSLEGAEEILDDYQRHSKEILPPHDQTSEESAGDFANKMMTLVKQHLDQRTADFEDTFEARVAAQVTAERAKIAEERAELAKGRQELELVVEQRVQEKVSEEEQKLRSAIMGEAEAQVAAERNEIGIVIEQEVQIRLPEERIKCEEAVAKQLKSLF